MSSSLPHICEQRDIAWDDDDEEAAYERLRSAILRDAGTAESEGASQAARQAALVVAAERGDRRAAIMLKMGITAPGVLPGL